MAKPPECKLKNCGNPKCPKHRFSKKARKKREQILKSVASKHGLSTPKSFDATGVRSVLPTAFESKRRKH